MGRTLGEGSFAKVKFARNFENGNFVAIKILDKNKFLGHEMIQIVKFLIFFFLLLEISTMKMIKHLNVIQLREVMASKTNVYIVLEFVDGRELFDQIAHRGKLKEDEVRSYFQQMINAMDYCHNRGVYHRDLKPENLLLDTHGVLKVTDFGLITFSQESQVDGLLHTTCGTPNYLAPEVLKDKGHHGSTSDVWSCGVILFVLMACHFPFDESNIMALYRKIYKAEFSFPVWFHQVIRNLLGRIKIPQILETEWFKKGYKPPNFNQEEDVSLADINAVFNDSEEYLVTERREKPLSINAFELISKSQGLNLGNLFENRTMSLCIQHSIKRKTHFTSQCPANEIMCKIEQTVSMCANKILRYFVEVFEVAPSLHMVELRKIGGDTLEFKRHFYIQFLKFVLRELLNWIKRYRLESRQNTWRIKRLNISQQFFTNDI
ncbi:hypothetical protein MKW94_020795 [Papaver nudicaule]|uniref:non-specific serine/threonine protein kinase n=1 Tax=Papaver nudicaule TaxID=74823 RepID=A0AA41V589_PAPNU|nr:hypothetical protein [Papaver nudicaule]